MALGTITALEEGAAQGPLFVDRVSIVGDDSYPTGGTTGFQALLRAALGKDRTIVDLRSKPGANLLDYDHVNDTLQAFAIADGAEVANTTDLSGTTFEVIVISK